MIKKAVSDHRLCCFLRYMIELKNVNRHSNMLISWDFYNARTGGCLDRTLLFGLHSQKRLTNLMKLFIFAILKKNIKIQQGGNYGYVFSKSRRYQKKMVRR